MKNKGSAHHGVMIICDRCNTRLWVTSYQDENYKLTIHVDGHDCKNIFIKNQIKQFKTPIKGEN